MIPDPFFQSQEQNNFSNRSAITCPLISALSSKTFQVPCWNNSSSPHLPAPLSQEVTLLIIFCPNIKHSKCLCLLSWIVIYLHGIRCVCCQTFDLFLPGFLKDFQLANVTFKFPKEIANKNTREMRASRWNVGAPGLSPEGAPSHGCSAQGRWGTVWGDKSH